MSADRPSFTAGRKWRAGADAVAGSAALLAIVILVNYLAATRTVWRRELGSAGKASLSPLTAQTLVGLTNEVKVTVLFSEESGLFSHIGTLLRQYAAQNPRVSLRFVDPVRNPEVAVLIRRQYQLGARAGQAVVFEYGGRSRVVFEGELSVYNRDDMSGLVEGRRTEVRRSGFLGELRFTAALAALADGAEIQAGYLTGHGEHAFDSEDATLGYAGFRRLLTDEKNLVLSPLDLQTNDVPDACRLVIIAGPRGAFLPIELARLDRFLQRGGGAMILLSPYAVGAGTGLEPWLLRWSVAAPPSFAGDPKTTSSNLELDLYSRTFGTHPLTAPLKHNSGTLYFPLPRLVMPVPAEHMTPDAPKAEILVTTGDSGMTKSDVKDDRIGFDPDHDKKDWRAPLAVAVEKGGVAGVAAGRGTARLVVIGDSIMFAKQPLEQPQNVAGNHEFASLCVSWLLDRPQALVIGPKPLREWKVNMDRGQRDLVRVALLGVLPGLALAAGFVVWLRGRA